MDDIVILQEARPNRSDAVRNRELLLATAGRLFHEHGVENVSMNMVAEAAGVGKGTLYRHFANKAELCEGILDEAQRDLQERTFAHLRQNPPAKDALIWFLGEVLGFVHCNADLIGGGTILLHHHPAHQWWHLTIRGLLGRIDFDHKPALPDLDYLADVLFMSIDIRTVMFQMKTHGWDMERIRAGLTSAVRTLLD